MNDKKTFSQLQKELADQIGKIKEEITLRNFVTHTDTARTKEARETEIKLEGLKDYYGMRRLWSISLLRCLCIILGFNISLIILVGFNIFKYKDEWFLRVVLTTNLADIIGLVYLVVKFLFSDQDLRITNQTSNKTTNS